MSENSFSEEDVPPPLETIGDLTYSPQSDYPFGKWYRMGMAEYTIYERATEEGYDAGIRWHLHYIHDHDNCNPGMLDEKQFALLFERFMPKGMNAYRQGLWKSSFIAGWTTVFLGLIRLLDEEEIDA